MLFNAISDDSLETVTGGVVKEENNSKVIDTKKAYCPQCKEEKVFNLYSGGRAICQTCGKQILL